MIKAIIIITVLLLHLKSVNDPVPEVKVLGAMKNMMMNGDLSAHADIDTLNNIHLYGLGPVADLKGEIVILDGKVFSTTKDSNKLLNQQDKVSKAAFLVYSSIEKWKAVSINAIINNYAELEKLVATTARKNGYDTEQPFAFKISVVPSKATYHVIDWKKEVEHTMDNHKQFAYSGEIINSQVTMLGFYSTHHQSIFTHHTTYMHIHILDERTSVVGHLDDVQVNGSVTIFLPEK